MQDFTITFHEPNSPDVKIEAHDREGGLRVNRISQSPTGVAFDVGDWNFIAVHTPAAVRRYQPRET